MENERSNPYTQFNQEILDNWKANGVKYIKLVELDTDLTPKAVRGNLSSASLGCVSCGFTRFSWQEHPLFSAYDITTREYTKSVWRAG